MDEKKSKKADLEPRKSIFIQVGVVLAMSIILFAFEVRQYDRKIIDLGVVEAKAEIEETILQTEQNTPPPPPEQPPQTTILEVVDDDVELDDDLTFDAEADDKTQMQEYVPIIEEEGPSGEAEIFLIVEEQPSFPGGEDKLQQFLVDNIKYPTMARESGIQGKVYVSFVVEPDGRISNAKVVRDIGGGCGPEALRVVNMMPRWNPGKQRTKAVRVSISMPVNFVLQQN
jgi:periplasmic protein TonB